jgi:hypothetical protein
MASRASKNEGLQGCSFIPLIDKLSNESVSVLGNERLGGTVGIVLARSVEIASGDGAILFGQGGEEGGRESVFLDKLIWETTQSISAQTSPMACTPQ